MHYDVNEKSRKRLSNVMQSNHLESRSVSLNVIPNYDTCLDILGILVTEESVEKVAKPLSGSAGPDKID